MIESLFQDLRYGWRMLFKSKALTLSAILSLGLGIGANTTAFGLVDEVFFKDLPVPNPDELVMLRANVDGNQRQTFSYSTYQGFLAENRTLSDLFAFAPMNEAVSAIIDGRAEIAGVALVSGNYFPGLGVGAFRGRTLMPDDDRVSAAPAAMVSYAYWRDRLGMDLAAVGKRIIVNGTSFTIVGVTPPAFYGAVKDYGARDITLPLAMEPRIALSESRLQTATASWLQVSGRRRALVSSAQVAANLEPALVRNTLDVRTTPRLIVLDGGTGIEFSLEAATPAVLLLGIGGLILLVVCANLANLMLARSEARRSEVTVRTAIGAGRRRIVRQLLTESSLLGIIGGTLGLAAASGGMRLIAASNVLAAPATLSVRALVFTAILSVLTGILFGLAPALHATRPPTRTAARSRIGKALLVTQMAVSLLLISSAGLLTRTLYDLKSANVGFNINNLVTFAVNPKLNRYDDVQVVAVYERMLNEIRGVPGVRSVTMSNQPLLGGGPAPNPIFVEESGAGASALSIRIGPGFLDAMEIPLLAGRPFNPTDNAASPRVAIISESLARAHFGGPNAVGKRFGIEANRKADYEVVGVARDAGFFRFSEPNPRTAYLPAAQSAAGPMSFAVRTADDPAPMVAAIVEAVREVDNTIPLFAIATTTEARSEILGFSKAAAAFGGALGLTALLLACVGLYGIISFTVARQTREIGVRMALGARRVQVIGSVMGQTLRLVAIGLAFGVPVSLAINQVLASMFYGLAPSNLFAITVALLVMIVVTALACYLPARKASRVDPMVALRYD
jgi:predicted permease